MAVARPCLGCGVLIPKAMGSRCQGCQLRRPRGRGWQRKREQVFARYGRACHVCGKPASDVDHIIPIGVDGDDSLANLRPSCAACNRGWR